MATLLELRELRSANSQEAVNFRLRVASAIAIKAYTFVSAGENATQAQIDWAKSALESPERYLDLVVNAGIAAGKESTIAELLALSDAFIQAATDLIVDQLLAR